MANRLHLIGIMVLGFLINPLPGSAAAGAGAAPASDLRPLYWSCANGSCEPTVDAGRDGDGNILLGYIKESAEPGTAPLYWACASLVHLGGCGRHALKAQPRYDDSVLLGYIPVEPRPGTVPLYWSCKQRDTFGECTDLAPDNRGGDARDNALLGYVYLAESPGN
jgi:hypothetical protein